MGLNWNRISELVWNVDVLNWFQFFNNFFLFFLVKSVSSQSNPIEYHISFSFKPRKAYGLLMYLSNASPRSPLFAMGLYNGEVTETHRE